MLSTYYGVKKRQAGATEGDKILEMLHIHSDMWCSLALEPQIRPSGLVGYMLLRWQELLAKLPAGGEDA